MPASTTPRSASARIFDTLAAGGSKIAVRCAGTSSTHEDLDRQSRAYAASLASLGVSRGDRVALLAGASADSLVALLGHYRVGALHVPINDRYRAREIAHILARATPKVLVHDEAGARVVDELALPAELTRISLGEGTGLRFAELLTSPPVELALPADDDGALMIFTSGTTGPSKGVVLDHGGVAANIWALTSSWRWSAADRLLLALPLFHVHGLCIGVHGALLHGMPILLHPRFDATAVTDAFAADEPPTIFMGVPTMYARLLEAIAGAPARAEALARARLFTSGSAPLPAADFHRFRALTGHAILERYGMSETLLTLTNPYEGERRPGSVGRAVVGCAARVVDDEGRPCEPGAPGELWVRSNGIMRGYWGDEQATRAAFTVDADGERWFKTGDVARVDADGYHYLLGRTSVDIIKSGGFKISTREIEEAIAEHPEVGEVAVVGVPDTTWGEAIAAAIVPHPRARPRDADAWLHELAVHLEARLADYKKPRRVLVCEDLPRNALGKLQKHLLGERFAALDAG